MMQVLRPLNFVHLLRTLGNNAINYSTYCRYRKLNIQLNRKFHRSHQKLSAKVVNGCEDVTAAENDAIEDFDESTEISYDFDVANNISLRNMLYSSEDSNLIAEINKCERVDEVCRVLENMDDDANDIRGVIQSVLVIYDIEKSHLTGKKTKEHMKKLSLPTEFQKIIDKILRVKASMSPDELTCCLLYLNKLGFGIKEDHMQELLKECLNRINNENEAFPLTSLSRFTVAMSSMQGNLYLYLICIDLMPRLVQMLQETKSSEDLRLISICLNHLPKLVTNNILSIYKSKVQELLQDGTINKETVRCILKIVNFLTYPQWSQPNMRLIRELSLILRDDIPSFQTRELVSLFKIVQNHLEPASLIPSITDKAKLLLKESPSAELLACAVLYSLPQSRLELTEIAKSIMFSSEEMSSAALPSLFKVLRLLKISNIKLIDAYWDRVLNEIESNPEEKENYRLARTSHRYMHFNNNLGGTYRHGKLEAVVSGLILNELRTGLSNMMPMRFSKLSSFIVAYGTHEKKGSRMSYAFPNFIVEKLEEIKEQLSVFDCLQISRGLQIALEMR